MNVIIGIDPHKSTHTVVALGHDETELCSLQVRANASQTRRLLDWAASFDNRTGAIGGAAGLGYLLGQQLVGAGEHVVDVPATLAARVRVLGTGKSNKTDPNDARSIAIAVAVLDADRSSSRGSCVGAKDAGPPQQTARRVPDPNGVPFTRGDP